MTSSWFDPGQNRESGGRESEQTGYAADSETTSESSGSGPAT